MSITFKKLEKFHFPLLHKWLTTSHVRAWWDRNIEWTPELIEEKYAQYADGYKRLDLPNRTIQKPMYAYIILIDGHEIGYIQYYNKHDFPPEQNYDISSLPNNLAAIDWYIGEVEYLQKGIGTKALNVFLENYVFKKFDNVFVDPDISNAGAIRTYKKAGFAPSKTISNPRIIFMIKSKQ